MVHLAPHVLQGHFNRKKYYKYFMKWNAILKRTIQYSFTEQDLVKLEVDIITYVKEMKHEHSYLGMVAYAHNSLQIEFITSIKLIGFLHVHSWFMHYSIFHLRSGIMALHATTGPLLWSNGVVHSFQQLSLVRNHIPA